MVLWGTGNVCNHLLQSNPKIQPEFFIDNNQEKDETVFYEKDVKATELFFCHQLLSQQFGDKTAQLKSSSCSPEPSRKV